MKFEIRHVLFFLSCGLLIWFTFDILSQNWWSWHIDFSIASQYGSFIGGFFSFLTVLLIYLTLDHQSRNNQRFAFENKFFSLIGYYRSNIENMVYRSPDSKKKDEYVTGQRVFLKIHSELIFAIENLSSIFKNEELESIIVQEALDEIENNEIVKARKIKPIDFIKHNIAYLIVFFGVHKEGKRVLKPILSRKYQEEFIRKVLAHFEKIPAEWDNNKDRIDENIHYKYFTGHQHRLGHHFRNLFQAVEYVNEFTLLNKKYDEKYNYVKTLRAQFSTYEQSVLFFNSISDLGKIWELLPKINKDGAGFHKDKMLITKYNLIRNLPEAFISDDIIKNYYPDIKYEGDKITEERKRLEKEYT